MDLGKVFIKFQFVYLAVDTVCIFQKTIYWIYKTYLIYEFCLQHVRSDGKACRLIDPSFVSNLDTNFHLRSNKKIKCKVSTRQTSFTCDLMNEKRNFRQIGKIEQDVNSYNALVVADWLHKENISVFKTLELSKRINTKLKLFCSLGSVQNLFSTKTSNRHVVVSKSQRKRFFILL